MKKDSTKFWVAAGVIIPLLIAVGFFNAPDIRMIRDNNIYPSCPSSFSQDFELKFANHGNTGGDLIVNVNEMNKKDFFVTNKDAVFIPANGESYKLKFKISENYSNQYNYYAKEDNITIIFDYSYNKLIFIPFKQEITCKYSKESYSYNYKLAEYS